MRVSEKCVIFEVRGVLDPPAGSPQCRAWLRPDLPAPPGRPLGLAPPHAGSALLQRGPAGQQTGQDHQPPAEGPPVQPGQGPEAEHQGEVAPALPGGTFHLTVWGGCGCGADWLLLLLHLRYTEGLQQTKSVLLSGFVTTLPRQSLSQVSNKEILYVSPTETL